ncbi:flagellar basal-body MS-ring/collar protein FliF [Hephaestia sp. GCM10023244]|uniref:flagellar basal-body MS-ring/collar protein FliF n=1 Tax=unclassified Hephaestia TaxID=2631281 RepID=UPI0020771682|nr:flagellar basal-body MS-ring/collar protein FliF [Hephaestia sp. MAHUQ-44]MCM8731260.1 flagellar M-ring protein FliF [Hephaestia sp. MAHUQ-44]
MNTAITPAAAPALPERFANPLKQIGGLLAQPAVKRSLPLILMIGLIAAAGLAWMMLSTPPQRTLFAGLPDADKAAVVQALDQARITSHIDNGTGAVTVANDDYNRARMLLASQNLPKSAPGGYAILDNLPMGVSRAVEGERMRQARETEMAQSIEEIDAVAEARVHLAMPEHSVFVRDQAAPSASVILKLQPGRALSDAQVRSVVNLVASSVPGMKPDAVTVVDQMGALLTKPDGGRSSTAEGNERIAFQQRVEDKYRQQLAQLLTPLVGADNFSTEVQAEVNLDETQAASESYKDGALRAEQGNWTTASGNGPQAAGGIPGALSNTPPPASTVAVPQPAAAAPAAGAPAPAAVATAAPGAGPMPDAMKASDNYSRDYALGKEVSVTRQAPGEIKRLSVAVLLRQPEGKPRGNAEIAQIEQLVKAAVGFDANRSDQVTVISRSFAGVPDLAAGQPWYEAGWLPMVVRNATAILIALLVLILGVRPLARTLLKKRDEAGVRAALGRPMGNPQGAPHTPGAEVSIDMLESSRGYDDRVGLVRGFTRDNPTRAALAVRDMIKADAQ